MIRNFIDEDYLKDISPELDSYKWDSETDFSNFIRQANNEIFEDLKRKNLNLYKLMPELSLRDSGTVISAAGTETEDSAEDTLNRLRLVYNVTVFTGTDTKQLILQGSSDDETFTTIETITITETGEASIRFNSVYQYYKIQLVQTDGTIDYSCYLIETTYDNIFAYKVLELIMRNVKKENQDSMHLKELDYAKIYNEKLQTSIFLEDTQDNFTNSGYVETQSNTVTVYK